MKRTVLSCLVTFLVIGCSSESSSDARPQPEVDSPEGVPESEPSVPRSEQPPPSTEQPPPPTQQPPPGPEPQPEADQPDPISSVKLDSAEILATLEHVADWQLATPLPRDPRHWSIAPLYGGLIDASLATGDPQYLAAVLRAGMRIEYELGSRTYHADGHAAGHSWLRLYLMNPDRDGEMLEPFIKQFDEIVEHPITEKISFAEPLPPGIRRTDRWTWSDALYMAPPTLAVLAQATGDDRYLEFMDDEYKFAYDALFDSEEGFFYRDATYIDQRTPTGEKVFWGRGNGWVYSGLALMLESLPEEHPTHEFYLELYRQMTTAVLGTQQPDGFWYPSLLDAEHAPIGETSATALFVLGLAWGMREGHLDPAAHWPAVERGWSALLSVIDSDGAVNSVQPFGEAPEIFDPTSRVPYGTGAVLMAGAQILRALNADAKVMPAGLFEAAQLLVPSTPDISSECKWACAW